MDSVDKRWFDTLTPYLKFYIANMDTEDQQRIHTITPYFELYKVQDIIHLVKQHLDKIRISEQIQHLGNIYNINKCSVLFTDTFNKLYIDDKKEFMFYVLTEFIIMCNRIKQQFKNKPIFRSGLVVFKIEAELLKLSLSTEYMECTESIYF